MSRFQGCLSSLTPIEVGSCHTANLASQAANLASQAANPPGFQHRLQPSFQLSFPLSHQRGANPLNQNPASQDLGPDPIIVPQVLLFLKVVNQGAGGRGGTCYLVPAAIKAARLGICD